MSNCNHKVVNSGGRCYVCHPIGRVGEGTCCPACWQWVEHDKIHMCNATEHPMGWECPRCGQVYAPHAAMCFTCQPRAADSTGTTVIWGSIPWRPISTAPRDGTSVILWLTEGSQRVVVGRYVEDLGRWMTTDTRIMLLHISHWMPLPEGPR